MELIIIVNSKTIQIVINWNEYGRILRKQKNRVYDVGDTREKKTIDDEFTSRWKLPTDRVVETVLELFERF